VLAGHGRANDREDAGADHGPDTQRRQRPRAERLLQRLARLFRLANQFVDGLARYQLVGQGSSPLYLEQLLHMGNLLSKIQESAEMIKRKKNAISN
jgi:hypothetical protein